jgi:hypothetical protein
MKLSEEFGVPVRVLKRMLSPVDAEELVRWRIKNPHWTTKLIDQVVALAYFTAVANGAGNVKFEDFRLKYGKQRKQTDEEMELIGQAIAASYGGYTPNG